MASTSSFTLIDLHHHIAPPAYITAMKDFLPAEAQSQIPPQVLKWSPESSIESMDRNDVATAMLSIYPPGVWFSNPQQSRMLSRICNDYVAELMIRFPMRFGSFAALPLPDSDGSLKEIEYALDVLKADGIGLMTSYGDKWLGDPSFMPVLDELNRRGAVVYIHPTAPVCCRNLIPWVAPPLLEFPFDTTRAVASLLYSGTLSKLKNIRWILSHAGGTVPMLAGRIENLGVRMRKELADTVPDGVEHELKKLFYEVAGSANRAAIAALMGLAPISQIMFGSDFPFIPIEATAKGIANLGLSSDQLRAIGRDNAFRLLSRLGAQAPNQ